MIHHYSGLSHDCYKCSVYHSILLWCSWAKYSKIIPKSSLSDSFSRTLFSPALPHLIILTWTLCLAFKAFIHSIIGSACSFFFSKKKLFFYFVASSTNITQCCLPPMLAFLIDEMSKYILSPGFLLLSSFFFGIFFCLIFSNKQLRQLLTLPVKLTLKYFAVASIK